MMRAAYDEWESKVITENWAGRTEWRVLVIGETADQYRIMAMECMWLPDRWLRAGQIALVPKSAVRSRS